MGAEQAQLFSRSDIRAVLILAALLLIGGAIGILQKTRAVIPPQVIISTVGSEATVADQVSRRPGTVTEEMLVKYKININTAPEDSLMLLPGIGEHLARRIVDYRREHGTFKHVGDLESVSGIGPVKLERMKDMITVNVK